MPDLNSVPPSPRFLATSSRRASSQQMPPPPTPGSPSLNILPSNQSAVNASRSSSLPSPQFPMASSFPSPPMGDNTGVGPGPGPLRHPRPLTAADLHLQLEKEQEAVVNRLTRELSVLRAAQNASVASNASSTSASASGTEPGQWGADTSHPALGTSHYQPVRHTRTPSSASARSFTANVGSVSTSSLAGGGISSPAPVRPTTQHPPIAIPGGGVSLSRQNSAASHRSRSRADSPSPAPPSLSSSYNAHHHYYHHHTTAESGSLPGYFNARTPAPGPGPSYRSHSGTSTSALATPASTATTATTTTTTTASTTTTSEVFSPGILPATSRFEETALRRAELEEVKRENEALRRRVRELEVLVRDAAATAAAARKEGGGGGGERGPPEAERSGGSRPRAVSAAMSVASSAVGVGVPEEEVRVGRARRVGAWAGAGEGV
ncbi:hypothetical protein NEMBOFW57_008833 [Staphylotrichum longicolle]|uniref:Uncharacterized protein n=1 Tax=Staphylotrichum longicolle TaxID=669026 RepID=A0AAD4EVU8_9PEZI|nr:hypothetical protein NEMBOFW57_008833 [Staphylotrichum longicolle]